MNIAMNTLWRLSVVMLALAAHSTLATCRDDITASTPDQDFTMHNNGTVTHNTTGLMWMRCSLGQTWDGSTCAGTASSYTWANALAAAESYAFADYNDWRLPNKNELASLVEQRCVSPAINSTIFPGTPGGWVWSSSPYANYPISAWYVNFSYGGLVYIGSGKSNRYNVRLVRAGH